MRSIAVALALAIATGPAAALEVVGVGLTGGDDDLREALIDASLVAQARKDDVTDPQEVLAAARSDYARMVGVMYDNGYFGPSVSIRVDGREAAEMSPLVVPEAITRIDIRVTAGARYRFGTLDVGPLVPRTELPETFRSGAVAGTQPIQEAARVAVRGWRATGHAKADVTGQQIVADHAARTVSADLDIAPGPQLRFGTLTIRGNDKVTTRRIDKIGDLPSGEIYSPAKVTAVSENVRRTGAFRSVVLTEAEEPNPDGTLDMTLTVTEQLPRRFGFGAEFSNTDGVELSGFWLHRNLLGGAERLEVNGTITGLGASGRDPGFTSSVRLTRPASPRSDTDLYILGELALLDERDYSGENVKLGFGWQRRVSNRISAELGFALNTSRIKDVFGESNYRLASFPLRVTYDKRNNFIAPTNGFYLDAQVEPFFGIKGTDDGTRIKGDLRFYEDFFEGDRLVVAVRGQLGAVSGPSLGRTPNYLLFYSGGGGTVRGQNYQSLGVSVPGGRTGGRSFLGGSAELRGKVTDEIELVTFYDWGYIGEESFADGTGSSHSGAGVGVRYITPIGPLRVDIATPLSGGTDGALSLYIGIGQAF